MRWALVPRSQRGWAQPAPVSARWSRRASLWALSASPPSSARTSASPSSQLSCALSFSLPPSSPTFSSPPTCASLSARPSCAPSSPSTSRGPFSISRPSSPSASSSMPSLQPLSCLPIRPVSHCPDHRGSTAAGWVVAPEIIDSNSVLTADSTLSCRFRQAKCASTSPISCPAPTSRHRPGCWPR